MKFDPILEEVWEAKDELARRFDYDMHRMAEHFRSVEKGMTRISDVTSVRKSHRRKFVTKH